MTITRSQAQKAVGEGQDIDYWLGVLKANEKVEFRHWNKVAQDLALRICKKGNFEYYPRGGNGFEAAWAAEWSPEYYNTNCCVYRLRADYTFAPDCSKTVDCANYESSCEGECENFKPKGRTFTEAFLEMPYGTQIRIHSHSYVKGCESEGDSILVAIHKNGSNSKDNFNHDLYSLVSNSWEHGGSLIFDPSAGMESDITAIYKPEVK